MPHTPLHALGTGSHAHRLRRVLRRLTARDINPSEDVTSVLTETLEAISARLTALERDAATRTKRSQTKPPAT